MTSFKHYLPVSLLTLTALSTLGLANSALAEYVVVTRGPGGAAHVVMADRIPMDAQTRPMTQPHTFPDIVVRGHGGAAHIVAESKELPNYHVMSYPEVGPSTAVGGGSQ